MEKDKLISSDMTQFMFTRCQRFYDEMMYHLMMIRLNEDEDELLSKLVDRFEDLFGSYIIKGPFFDEDEI